MRLKGQEEIECVVELFLFKRSKEMMNIICKVGVIIILLPLLNSCNKNYIANTTIEDTPFNRKVIAFCERYRRAVEKKDIVELLNLASPKYYEDGGTPSGEDDYDYNGLKELLIRNFSKIESIRYEIFYKRISRKDNIVFVDYVYNASYQIKKGDNSTQWVSGTQNNRLVLEVLKDEQFKIVSGM